MSAHPSRYSLQFVSGSIAFQVVASPANQCDIPRYVPLACLESINARRAVVRPSDLVAVIDRNPAARTVHGLLNPRHHEQNREGLCIERDAALLGAINHALTQDRRPHLERTSAQPLKMLLPLAWRVVLSVKLAAARCDPLAIALLVRPLISSPTGTTRRGDTSRTQLMRRKVLQICRVLRTALITGPHLITPSNFTKLMGDVWGNESANTAALEVRR